MAGSAINTLVVGLAATGAIAQFNAVSAAGAVASAAGNCLGFATAAAASGARVTVAAGGTAIAIASAAIALGAAVEVAAAGQVATKSAGIAVGRALTAAANVGDQIEILIIPN